MRRSACSAIMLPGTAELIDKLCDKAVRAGYLRLVLVKPLSRKGIAKKGPKEGGAAAAAGGKRPREADDGSDDGEGGGGQRAKKKAKPKTKSKGKNKA